MPGNLQKQFIRTGGRISHILSSVKNVRRSGPADKSALALYYVHYYYHYTAHDPGKVRKWKSFTKGKEGGERKSSLKHFFGRFPHPRRRRGRRRPSGAPTSDERTNERVGGHWLGGREGEGDGEEIGRKRKCTTLRTLEKREEKRRRRDRARKKRDGKVEYLFSTTDLLSRSPFLLPYMLRKVIGGILNRGPVRRARTEAPRVQPKKGRPLQNKKTTWIVSQKGEALMRKKGGGAFAATRKGPRHLLFLRGSRSVAACRFLSLGQGRGSGTVGGCVIFLPPSSLVQRPRVPHSLTVFWRSPLFWGSVGQYAATGRGDGWEGQKWEEEGATRLPFLPFFFTARYPLRGPRRLSVLVALLFGRCGSEGSSALRAGNACPGVPSSLLAASLPSSPWLQPISRYPFQPPQKKTLEEKGGVLGASPSSSLFGGPGRIGGGRR